MKIKLSRLAAGSSYILFNDNILLLFVQLNGYTRYDVRLGYVRYDVMATFDRHHFLR